MCIYIRTIYIIIYIKKKRSAYKYVKVLTLYTFGVRESEDRMILLR